MIHSIAVEGLSAEASSTARSEGRQGVPVTVPLLHTHSAFSMRRGATLPELLATAAARLGYSHMAITDRDGLWAVPRFIAGCKRAGINYILGAQLVDPAKPARRVLVLTENIEAFRTLSEIVSLRQLDLEDKFNPVDAIIENVDRGFVLFADHPRVLKELHGKIPPGRLFGELTWGERSITRKRFFAMVKTCRELQRPSVATGNIHMASRDEYYIHALLTAMRTGRCLRDKLPACDPMCHLQPPSEFERPFHAYNLKEALINATELAARCAWEWPERKWLIPPPPDLPQGMRPIDQLKEMVTSRLKRKYKKWTPTIQARLKKELRIIHEHGFESFFLIVADVVREAHSRGYQTLGRGSAGDSIVSFGLDISEVDPIRYDLYFERFLNPERSSPPDIDLDFSWKHRDEMVEYVEQKYGTEKVSSVGTIITLGLKSAFRETGKALGYSNDEITRWSLYLPTWWDDTGEHIDEHPIASELPLNEEPLKTIMSYTLRLMDLPIHQSVHVGGLVLSPRPISRYAPLSRAAKGFVITQYDMRDCEKVGLIKLDLLSQRGLGAFEDVLESLGRHGVELAVDIEDMDQLSADEKTDYLFRTGKTVGCFDAESAMIRTLTRKLGAHSYDLHMAATSLIRPGVSQAGMMDEFIRRHHDPSTIEHVHPKMGEILKDTYGVIVYQEDVLKILHELAGVSLGQADLLRRMMSGKSIDGKWAKDDLQAEFHRCCTERGISKEVQKKLWEQISSFVGYSFCKAHAAQFARLAYQSAYLKAHHPSEFFAARLSNVGGYYPPDFYIRDSRRFGMTVELPEVNRSEKTYVGRDFRLIMGLEQVTCLREESIDSILLARNTGGPFRSVSDFLARTGVGYEQTHALIRVGAFRSLHTPRPALLTELAEAFKAKIHRPGPARQPLLFADRIGKPSGNGEDKKRNGEYLQDYSLWEQIQAEVDVLGLIASIHPLEPLEGAMKRAGLVSSADAMHYEGRRVRMGGILVSFKPATTKEKKEPMALISLEDLGGTFDTVVFPDAYARHAIVLRAGADQGLCMEGKLELNYGEPNLIVDKIMPLKKALMEGSPRNNGKRKNGEAEHPGEAAVNGSVDEMGWEVSLPPKFRRR